MGTQRQAFICRGWLAHSRCMGDEEDRDAAAHVPENRAGCNNISFYAKEVCIDIKVLPSNKESLRSDALVQRGERATTPSSDALKELRTRPLLAHDTRLHSRSR